MNTMTVTPIAQAPSVRTAAPRPATARGAVSTSGQVRLTRRGRVVVLATVLFVALAALVAFGGGSMATEEAGERPATEVVVVNEGDTLWGIAATVAEDGQVRSMVHEIRELNNLDSSVVALGQKLHVPVEG